MFFMMEFLSSSNEHDSRVEHFLIGHNLIRVSSMLIFDIDNYNSKIMKFKILKVISFLFLLLSKRPHVLMTASFFIIF